MKEPEIQYGPIARGTYIALICATPLVLVIYPSYLGVYIGLLLFLGVGLKPLLEYSGLYGAYISFTNSIRDRLDRKWIEKRRREVDASERSKKLKNSRVKDPNLPRNW